MRGCDYPFLCRGANFLHPLAIASKNIKTVQSIQTAIFKFRNSGNVHLIITSLNHHGVAEKDKSLTLRNKNRAPGCRTSYQSKGYIRIQALYQWARENAHRNSREWAFRLLYGVYLVHVESSMISISSRRQELFSLARHRACLGRGAGFGG